MKLCKATVILLLFFPCAFAQYEDDPEITLLSLPMPKGGELKIKTKGRVRLSGRLYERHSPQKDKFLLYDARIGLKAYYLDFYEIKVDYGIREDKFKIKDVYLNIGYSDLFQIKMGRYKIPFSLEELTSSLNIDFEQRSILSALTPKRDVGVMCYGKLPFLDNLGYYIGIFNGSGAKEQNDAKDLALRLEYDKIRDASEPLGLLFAWSLTYGRQDEDARKPKLQTEAKTPFFVFHNDTDLEGARLRTGFDIAKRFQQFCIKGEIMWQSLELERQVGGVLIEEKEGFRGWYLTLSWFATGEIETFKKVKPKNDFDPVNWTGPGAIEFALRYAQMDIGGGLLEFVNTDVYANPSKMVEKVRTLTLGVSWYLNKYVRVRLNYVRTRFDEPIRVTYDLPSEKQKMRENEDAILFTIHFAF
jgi:phosphate-selective porin OprO/OprP